MIKNILKNWEHYFLKIAFKLNKIQYSFKKIKKQIQMIYNLKQIINL